MSLKPYKCHDAQKLIQTAQLLHTIGLEVTPKEFNRLTNALAHLPYELKVDSLLVCTDAQLLKLNGLGRKSLRHIKKALTKWQIR